MPDLAVLTPPHQRDRGHRPGRGAGLPVSVGVVLVQSLPDGHVVLPLTQAAHLGVLGDHTWRSPSSSSTTTTTLARRRCVRCAEAFPCRPWKILEDLDRGFARSAETRACFTHQELERHLHPKRRVMAITARNWTTSRTRSDNVRALTPPLGGVVVSDHLLTSSLEALSASSSSMHWVRWASSCVSSSLIRNRRASFVLEFIDFAPQ